MDMTPDPAAAGLDAERLERIHVTHASEVPPRQSRNSHLSNRDYFYHT